MEPVHPSLSGASLLSTDWDEYVPAPPSAELWRDCNPAPVGGEALCLRLLDAPFEHAALCALEGAHKALGFQCFDLGHKFPLKVESAHVGRNNHRKIAAFFRTLVSDARKKAHPLPGGRDFKAHPLPGGRDFKAHPLPGGLASPK